jgi:pilus assembly protein CpaB
MDRRWLVLVGFLALALGMFVSRQVYCASQFKSVSAQPVDVVVAANDIGVGAKIEDKDIKVLKAPATNLPSGCFRTKSEVIGRRVTLPIAKGEFILPNKLAATHARSRPRGLIPPGMRAVSVRVDDVIAGFVVPGTRLDVLLTDTLNEQRTITVLENVAVLAAGQRLERNSVGEPQNAAVVTLLVSPQDAEKLTLASSKGHIQLMLRNPLDQKQPMQRDTPLKPIPPKIPPSLRVKPIPPEIPLSPRLRRLT